MWISWSSTSPGLVVMIFSADSTVWSGRVVLTQTNQGLLEILSGARYALTRMTITFTPEKMQCKTNSVKNGRFPGQPEVATDLPLI